MTDYRKLTAGQWADWCHEQNIKTELQQFLLSQSDELDRLQRELALSKTDRGSLFARLCETEAQLAEARELLREARERGILDGGDGFYDRIDAFLAAKKEGER